MVNANEQPQTTRVLRVRLQTADKAILLYSASDIEMLTPEQLLTHPFLQRVGPDVLDMRLTANDVKARLLSPKFRNRQFSGLLLDLGVPGRIRQLPSRRNSLGGRAGGAA